MKPIAFTYAVLMLMPFLSLGQKKSFDPNQTISADSAKKNFADIFRELKLKHPGFYRYNTKKQFDPYIDSVIGSIKSPQTQLSYYRKLKPVIARIGCLHTGISFSDAYTEYLNGQPNLIPFQLYFVENKAFITEDYSAEKLLPIGAEVLSVNKQPVKSIREQIFAAIPSDGYNITLKQQLINHEFAKWYRAAVEVATQFVVTIRTPDGAKEYTLNGVTNQQIPAPAIKELGTKPRLQLSLSGETAFMTIHSFAKTGISAGKQDFRKFLGDAIKQMNTGMVKTLVLDLRNNSGGTDVNAALLCAYLMDKPYRYWDRIEVTEPFAVSVKGPVKLFYGRPVKKDSVYVWLKPKLTREFDFYEPQLPHKDAFNGKVYILINGLCMSSCADVVSILQHNNRATLIGEETGGGYQGNTSGLIPETQLAFRLNLSVPLLKYYNAVDVNKNVGRGAQPDIPVAYTLQDVLAKKDLEMEAVMKTVK